MLFSICSGDYIAVMPASPLNKILNEKRLGFVQEHGSRERPIKEAKR